MKNLKVKILIVLFPLMLAGLSCEAQQDPRYSMYMFNGLAINPAFAGTRGGPSLNFLLREQWMGINGRPRTQTLNFHSPLKGSPNNALGFSLVHDKLGVTTTFNSLFTYAYHLHLGRGHFLSMGLQGGLQSFSNRWSEADRIDEGDEVIPQVNTNVWLPLAGTGFYYFSEHFYAGFSVPNLVKNKYDRMDDAVSDSSARQVRHLFVSAGGAIDIIENVVTLKPSILFKSAEQSPYQVDLNLMVTMKERFSAGASFRPGESLVFMMELKDLLLPGLRLAYGYDVTTSQLRKVTNGSHEFMLGYDFQVNWGAALSPRFF